MSQSLSDYSITLINTLAYPRGSFPTCELTGLSAKYVLSTPSAIFHYATEEHAVQAWNGIIHKTHTLLGKIRNPPTIVGNEEERERRSTSMKEIKMEIIEISVGEAAKYIAQKNFNLAIPGSVLSIKLSKEVYGDNTLELIHPNLLLSESHLGLGRIQQAEDIASLATCVAHRNGEFADCRINSAVLFNGVDEVRKTSTSFKTTLLSVEQSKKSKVANCQIHRTLAKICLAKQEFEHAKVHLAEDIYQSSCLYGPESIFLSQSYFLLSQTFLSVNATNESGTGLSNHEGALGCMDKLVDIWYKHLISLRSSSSSGMMMNVSRPATGQLSSFTSSTYSNASSDASSSLPLSEVVILEGLQQLQTVTDARLGMLGETHIATGEALFTTGMLFMIAGDVASATSAMEQAEGIFEARLGSDHATTMDIKEMLLSIRSMSGFQQN